jgi:hypothetical protein
MANADEGANEGVDAHGGGDSVDAAAIAATTAALARLRRAHVAADRHLNRLAAALAAGNTAAAQREIAALRRRNAEILAAVAILSRPTPRD